MLPWEIYDLNLESRPWFEIPRILQIWQLDQFQIRENKMSSSSNSDEEWRKKGVEFKIIDEGKESHPDIKEELIQQLE